MKKLAYLCLALCLFTTIASAQKITAKTLQGKWMLTAFESEGIFFDLAKNDVIIPDEIKSQIPPEQLEQAKTGMLASMSTLKGSYMLIADSNFTATLGQELTKGTYTLTEKDKKQFMIITMEGEGPDETEVLMKDNKLHLIQYTNGVKEGELIYTKG